MAGGEGVDARPPRAPEPLQCPAQLLVEGKDAQHFFHAFLEHRIPGLAGLTQIHDFGGVTELRAFLRAFVKRSGFGAVRRVAVVRDAEAGPVKQAFQSVRHALSSSGLVRPDRAGRWTRGRVQTGTFILPDNSGSGMLETLLCRTLETDMERCIQAFFECAGVSPSSVRRDKQRARAFLATRNKPHPSVGIAARKGYWNLDHAAFGPLQAFLSGLGATEPPEPPAMGAPTPPLL